MLYLDAVSSIAAGMPDGVFSNVFCEALTAQTAFINNLFTHYIEMFPDGEIRVKNFTGRDGAVPGFWFKGKDGSIEANNIKTRGMDAINANIKNSTTEGTLVAGNRWNIDGSDKNINGKGLFVPGQNTDGEHFVKVNNVICEDIFSMNKNSLDKAQALFYNTRLYIDQDSSISSKKQISGEYTASELNSRIAFLLGGESFNNVPLCGSIYSPMENQGDTGNYGFCIASCLGSYYNDGYHYRIYAQNTSGNNYVINLTGSRKLKVNLLLI